MMVSSSGCIRDTAGGSLPPPLPFPADDSAVGNDSLDSSGLLVRHTLEFLSVSRNYSYMTKSTGA
jgi:hypothetical protein